MTASQKKLSAYRLRNLAGAGAKGSQNATVEAAGPTDGTDPVDGIGPTGGIEAKHSAVAQAIIQPRTPPIAMLRFADVIQRTGLSRTTIWRKVRAGTFPAPIALGENSVGWKSEWVDGWVDDQPRVTYAPEPEAAVT